VYREASELLIAWTIDSFCRSSRSYGKNMRVGSWSSIDGLLVERNEPELTFM
jgi:hypothetical protein